MNKNKEFKLFLESLKGTGYDPLIEIVREGFDLCLEAKVEAIDDVESNAENIGNQIVKLLNLQVNENGMVSTAVGDKSPVALALEIKKLF